jgi:hypothetical protein
LRKEDNTFVLVYSCRFISPILAEAWMFVKNGMTQMTHVLGIKRQTWNDLKKTVVLSPYISWGEGERVGGKVRQEEEW